MADCCGGNTQNIKSKAKEDVKSSEKMPKSLIGKWLHNYGKKLEEKDRKKAAHSCC